MPLAIRIAPVYTASHRAGFTVLDVSGDEIMRHDCRGGGWTTKIADAIDNASPGDTLIIETDAAKELAKGALLRMRPGLGLHFEVGRLPNPFA